MPIELHEPTKARTPVLRRKALGQTAITMLIDTPVQRDQLKRNPVTNTDEPVLKPNGKAKQELVVELLTLPGTTMPAGLGDEVAIPVAGDIVRTILKGGAFGQWIEAKNAHGGLQVGDVVIITTTYGQAYDAHGAPIGPKLETQAEVDAVPREKTLGLYGDLTLRRPTPEEAVWVAKAEAAYHAKRQADAISIDPAAEADIFG